MRNSHRLAAGVAALLLPLMWEPVRADCDHGSGAQSRAEEIRESIGTGTMPEGQPKESLYLGNRPLDELLGIRDGSGYKGPWREGADR